MYAVVFTGGKQYKVAEGDRLRVEKLDTPVGESVELTNVRMIAREDGLIVDPGALASAKVVALVLDQDKRKKVRIFKKKRRKGYQRTNGHRQPFTELKITQIQA
ncbi:MAG: 50S ribosomal protein L21 [Candidatus Hydrogenedentes bacterium]|nr:50S ribosomal protein L21 [Candidatus Hydrogenedentota bacterium]